MELFLAHVNALFFKVFHHGFINPSKKKLDQTFILSLSCLGKHQYRTFWNFFFDLVLSNLVYFRFDYFAHLNIIRFSL